MGGSVAKVDATGRTKKKDDHHVRLYSWMTGTEAWKALSGNAIKLLVYIATFDKGDNNGELFMSERKAAAGTGFDRKTVRKLFRELEEKGFISCTAAGSFKAKRSPAAQWRLTWKSWPARSQGPTHDYRRWQPREKCRGEKFPITGGEIPHANGKDRSTGGETPPVAEAELQISANPDWGETGPQSLAIGRGEASVDLRLRITTYFFGLKRAERQRAWAEAHGSTREDVHSYCISDPERLPPPKIAAMVCSIKNEKAEARRRAAEKSGGRGESHAAARSAA